jgi:hypothetical protein
LNPIDGPHFPRQEIDADPSSVLAQHDEPADALLKLTHVPAPLVIHQDAKGLARDPRRFAIGFQREACEETPDQNRNVLAPFAKGRNRTESPLSR